MTEREAHTAAIVKESEDRIFLVLSDENGYERWRLRDGLGVKITREGANIYLKPVR